MESSGSFINEQLARKNAEEAAALHLHTFVSDLVERHGKPLDAATPEEKFVVGKWTSKYDVRIAQSPEDSEVRVNRFGAMLEGQHAILLEPANAQSDIADWRQVPGEDYAMAVVVGQNGAVNVLTGEMLNANNMQDLHRDLNVVADQLDEEATQYGRS